MRGTPMEVDKSDKKQKKKSSFPSWATGKTLRRMQKRRQYMNKKKQKLRRTKV